MSAFETAYVSPRTCFGIPSPTGTPPLDGPLCESFWPVVIQPPRGPELAIKRANVSRSNEVARTDVAASHTP